MKIPKLFDADLMRAAEILEREARMNLGMLGGKYNTRSASERLVKDANDEMLRLAKRFRKVAGTL